MPFLPRADASFFRPGRQRTISLLASFNVCRIPAPGLRTCSSSAGITDGKLIRYGAPPRQDQKGSRSASHEGPEGLDLI